MTEDHASREAIQELEGQILALQWFIHTVMETVADKNEIKRIVKAIEHESQKIPDNHYELLNQAQRKGFQERLKNLLDAIEK